MRTLLSLFFLLSVMALQLHAASLTLPSPGEVYFDPDKAAVINFKPQDIAVGRVLNYTIRDYLKKEVKTGSVKVESADKAIFDVTLPAGYYELTFPEINQTFGLLAMKAYSGTPDYFFGLNTGFSWFPHGEFEPSMMGAYKRSGIAIVHEFFSWQKVDEDKKADKWGSGQGLYYKLVRLRLAGAGLKVMDEFHDAPTMSGADMNKRSTERFPKDMLYTYSVWKDYLQQFAPLLGNMEVWNETDDKFGPASGYVPMLKAVAYAKQQAKVDTPITGGIFSQLATDGFRDDHAKNRMIEVADAISYHNYADPTVIEGTVKWYRDYLARYGRESLPIYITECGWPWTGESAKNIVMKAVEAKACGIQQMYPFFAQYYQEGALDFSLLRNNRSPMAVMAGYCRLANLLSNFEYVGDLKIKDPQVLRSRVFSNGKEYIAVIFPSGTGNVINVPDVPIDRMEGIDGRVVAKETKKATISDGVMYWFLNADKIRNNFVRYIDANTATMKLFKRSKLPLAEATPSPIVLQPRVKTEQLVCGQSRPAGYFIAAGAEKKFELSTDVFNLSDADADVTLKLEVPNGVVVTALNPDKLKIGPNAQSTVGWNFDLSQYFTGNRGFQARIIASDASGNVLDYASVPLLSAIQDRKVYTTPRWNGNGKQVLPDNNDWSKVPAIVMARNGNFEADDFGVDARFMWNEKGVYFRFIVKDIVHAQENDPYGSWRQDSIQLAIDPVNSMRNDGLQYEYGISMRGTNSPGRWHCWIKGQKPVDKMSANSKLQIRRDESQKQTVYTGILSGEDIAPFAPTTQNKIGFDFCVNNSNGGQERETLEWTPGIETGSKDASLFGLLILQP